MDDQDKFKQAQLERAGRRIDFATAEFAKFRAPGKEFTYLGTVFVVRSHRGSDESGDELSCMIADYKDLNGIIHTIEFDAQALPALITQNAL